MGDDQVNPSLTRSFVVITVRGTQPDVVQEQGSKLSHGPLDAVIRDDDPRFSMAQPIKNYPKNDGPAHIAWHAPRGGLWQIFNRFLEVDAPSGAGGPVHVRELWWDGANLESSRERAAEALAGLLETWRDPDAHRRAAADGARKRALAEQAMRDLEDAVANRRFAQLEATYRPGLCEQAKRLVQMLRTSRNRPVAPNEALQERIRKRVLDLLAKPRLDYTHAPKRPKDYAPVDIAAAEQAAVREADNAKDWDRPIVLIGYSHGGNIVMDALQRLRGRTPHIAAAFTVATPVLNRTTRWNAFWREFGAPVFLPTFLFLLVGWLSVFYSLPALIANVALSFAFLLSLSPLVPWRVRTPAVFDVLKLFGMPLVLSSAGVFAMAGVFALASAGWNNGEWRMSTGLYTLVSGALFLFLAGASALRFRSERNLHAKRVSRFADDGRMRQIVHEKDEVVNLLADATEAIETISTGTAQPLSRALSFAAGFAGLLRLKRHFDDLPAALSSAPIGFLLFSLSQINTDQLDSNKMLNFLLAVLFAIYLSWSRSRSFVGGILAAVVSAKFANDALPQDLTARVWAPAAAVLVASGTYFFLTFHDEVRQMIRTLLRRTIFGLDGERLISRVTKGDDSRRLRLPDVVAAAIERQRDRQTGASGSLLDKLPTLLARIVERAGEQIGAMLGNSHNIRLSDIRRAFQNACTDQFGSEQLLHCNYFSSTAFQMYLALKSGQIVGGQIKVTPDFQHWFARALKADGVEDVREGVQLAIINDELGRAPPLSYGLSRLSQQRPTL